MDDTQKFIVAMDAAEAVRLNSGIYLDGKLYSMVRDRVEIFRRHFGSEYGIDTSVDFREVPGYGLVAIAKAKISRQGTVMAAGTAMEIVGTNKINDVSPLEAAETSAIGRALAAFGLHGGEYATGNEIEAHMRKKETQPIRQAQEIPEIPEVPAKPVRISPYVPRNMYEDNFDMWDAISKVTDSVTMFDTKTDLAHYWTSILEFRHYVNQNDPGAMKELEGIFQVAARGMA